MNDRPYPNPDIECRYYLYFASHNLLREAREWIAKNPQPQYFCGGPWAWIHAEMPDLPEDGRLDI